MTWLHNANNLNKAKERSVSTQPVGGSFFGFKFHFRGRFSRKQRAGSFIFSAGNLPLTTLSACVDYGFVTVPLDNSLISIKIYLFKNYLRHDIFSYNIIDKPLVKSSNFSFRSFFKRLAKPVKGNNKFFGKARKLSVRELYNRLYKRKDKYRLKFYKKKIINKPRFFKDRPKMSLSLFSKLYKPLNDSLFYHSHWFQLLKFFGGSPYDLFLEPPAYPLPRLRHRFKDPYIFNFRRNNLFYYFFRIRKLKRLDRFYHRYYEKVAWRSQVGEDIALRQSNPSIYKTPFRLKPLKPRKFFIFSSGIPFYFDVPLWFYPIWFQVKKGGNYPFLNGFSHNKKVKFFIKKGLFFVRNNKYKNYDFFSKIPVNSFFFLSKNFFFNNFRGYFFK